MLETYPKIVAFIREVVPENLRIMSNNLTAQQKTDLGIWKNEFINPLEIMTTNPIFDSFRKKPQGKFRLISRYKYS